MNKTIKNTITTILTIGTINFWTIGFSELVCLISSGILVAWVVSVMFLEEEREKLPSDGKVEDWYTKDFDSLEPRFWEQGPYVTHGDRVEEIKDALHYFIDNK